MVNNTSVIFPFGTRRYFMMRITLCALFLSYSSLSRPISTFRKSPLFFSNTSADNLALENIIERIDQSATGINREYVDIEAVASKVHKGMFKGITWREFDNLASETSAYMSTDHPDYTKLASRIAIQSLHRNAPQTFSEAIELLYNYIDPKTGLNSSFISKELYNFVKRHSDEIDRYIQHERDFDIDFFGFKTLEKSYLFRIEDNIIETPQYMFMRVALGIHMKDNDLRSAFETYDMMSDKWFIHASPTLFNSGTPRPQLSSCFLLGIQSDSIEGIYATLQKCAQISKSAGGIGLYVQNVRSKGSSIGSSKGISNGIVPMLRVFDATARYIDQGGRRPGAIAIYLEPWHPDIFEVLDLKKNTGKEETRARNLFYGLWIPDLFMKRVEEDGEWALLCPNECPGLDSCWGDAFEKLYMSYVESGKAKRIIKARELWYAILDAQMETGTPYMLYKDSVNMKSNQKNLGTIKCSNLCTEIMEFTSADEVAVCNLASLVLPRYIRKSEDSDSLVFDHMKLKEVTKVVVRNLNKIIDINYYPVKEAEVSNMKHRPIGLGVQGLADTFQMLNYSFDSNEARKLNREIFETLYFAALEASCELAEKYGYYESYPGSPASHGQLQMDLWQEANGEAVILTDRWNWLELRDKIKRFGLRNSLLVAPMPTASTAQILGFNECFEPYTSNMYVRRVRAGEFIVVNPHLMKELVSRGKWNREIRNQLMSDGGSVANMNELPSQLKEVYRTVWEIKQRSLVDMAADRGPFIDQSQSLNVFMSEPDYSKLTSMHFYAWKKGLKTGMYYLRTKPATQAIQFTLSPRKVASLENKHNSPVYGEVCTSCSG